MKKVSKIIFMIIAVIMLVTILYFGFSRFIKTPFVEDNVWNSQKGEQEEEIPVSRNHAGVLPYSENTREMKETFSLINKLGTEFDIDLECCVNDVTVTKDAIDTDAGYYADDGSIQFDENYNILNDFMYIAVNVTIKNTTEQEMSPYLNSFRLIAINPGIEDSTEITYGGELKGYKTRKDLFVYDKSYARKTILPGEEFSCNLVFFVREKEFADYDFYIKHSTAGSVTPEYDKESIYVRIK